MEGVSAVSPVFTGQAALQYKDNAQGANLYGIDPDAENAVMRVSDDLIRGDFSALSRSNDGILLGDRLAEELEVAVGDTVSAVIPTFVRISTKSIYLCMLFVYMRTGFQYLSTQ